MTLSDLSIKNPVFAWMLMVGLIVFGWLGFTKMGVSMLPDVDFPIVMVSVTLEGAAPEVMETEVADVIEDAVMSVQGVKEISSSSRQGSTTVTVEFELGRNIDLALQDVQSKIAQTQRNLPREIDPPVILKTNPEDQPIMWLGLSGDRPLKDLMEYTHDFLKDQFTSVAGVGDVFLGGYIDPNLRVWLDARKLDERQLTVDDVIAAVQQQHAEQPAGYIDTGKQELNVRVMGEAATPEEFSKIVIAGRAGAPIWRTFRIGDVATVEDGLADVRRISRNGGKPAVGLGIRKQRGANAVAVAQAVKKRVAAVQKSLPQGMSLRPVNDATRFIEESTHELNFTLLLSALLTALVCWAFLGSWSSTLNVLLAIPTSIVGAFLILNWLGFTLNTFTLLGLSLAIGIVVDDAIMVLENIVRYHELGYPRVRAALVGAREITFPAMAASVAILAIFIPVVFMKGIVGAFFYQFGITMSVAVMLSLLEALTLAPMRCSQFLDSGRGTWVGRRMEHLLDRVTENYRALLARCLDHRWKTIGGALLVFAVSLILAKTVKKEFVPAQDQSMFLVRIQTPLGSSIGFTDSVMKQAEEWILAQPNVKDYYAAIGGFGGGEVNTGIMFVTLKPPKERVPLDGAKKKPTQQEFQRVVGAKLGKIPGVFRAVAQDLSLAGFTSQRGFPIEFTIRGPDWDALAGYGKEIMKRMADSGYAADVDTDYQLGMPEVRVIPDRAKAAARGVSIQSIGNAINAMVGGLRVGKFTRGGKRYDIRVRLVGEDRSSPQDISRIWVRNNRGEVVRLSEVTTITEKPTLLSISRRNRERAIAIFANVSPGKAQADALDRVEKIGKEVLPDGYRLVLSGSAQTMKESFASLLFALLLGILVAYMVLASQFNSFLHPVTVLLALPFSVTGAFLALALAGHSLNLYSFIGLILLMGIVKKNSILLVDFTNERRKHGLELRAALLDACPVRLRPILMTSVACIVAAIPPAMGIGPGAETRIPMALVVIGGVAVSTLLTLFVVPCAYSLFARWESHAHDRDLKEALAELGEPAGRK
jgi:hydrophobe/amphiphile efflux-1 (HAE1) family protein